MPVSWAQRPKKPQSLSLRNSSSPGEQGMAREKEPGVEKTVLHARGSDTHAVEDMLDSESRKFRV